MGKPEPTTPAPIESVLETVLYFSDEQRTETFYGRILGMRLLDREPGRSLFYRLGGGVLLLFNASATARGGGSLPPHGAEGPIHTCLRVPPDSYADWKRHLVRGGVEIIDEKLWERGRSFYFSDPHGNLLEIADADIWPA